MVGSLRAATRSAAQVVRWVARRAAVPLLAVVVVLQPFVVLWVVALGPVGADARGQDRDAVWLGHAWVDGRKNEADLAALLRDLGGARTVRELYVHVGPTSDDGSLDASRYPRAAWLLAAVHRRAPWIRVQAWLGDVVDSEGPSGLDLSRRVTRARLTESAARLLDAGFAGINLDLEPVHSGDTGYLRVLDSLRALTRGRGRVLSADVPQTDPLPPLRATAGVLTGHPKWWSGDYLAQVARRVDQIDVMAYDTALPLPSLFSGYVAQQTALALKAAPPDVDVLVGLPAYATDNLTHHASAETVAAAVRGVQLGLTATPGSTRRRIGVALYVDYAARPADWAAYRSDWVAASHRTR